MPTPNCFSGMLCRGCSICSSNENDLEAAQRRKREEDKLRADNKPTLHVSFAELMKASK